ncbi:hypothetical protein M3Y94_00853200 [Aphelenchoides besseyi]|nr:hypothetical protein M3Y94_00853200 [Aphelenchoides besseyi]
MIPAPLVVISPLPTGINIYFGNYDKDCCTDFRFANLYGDKFSWTIEVEVRINGVLMKRKQTLSISSTVNQLHLPSDMFRYLIAEEFVFFKDSESLYLNNSLTIEFTLDDGSSFLIEEDFLFHDKSTNLTIIAPTPTTDASQFVEPDYLIGKALMQYYCFYFDYEQLRLGIAYSITSGND